MLLCFSCSVVAATMTWQALEPSVRAFLQGELKSRKATFRLNRPGSNLHLPACDGLTAYWPPGVPMTGSTFVEVSCPDKGWSVRYPVVIDEKHMGVVTTRRMQAGEVVGAGDVRLAELPNAALGNNLLANIDDVIGKVVRSGLPPGTWMRTFMVQAPIVVHANQPVRVLAEDGGFQVSADGIATNNAAVGEAVSVRMPSGRLIRGTVRADGNVVVQF
jgi:flagella basal body P-ring formation protein FlgA